MRSATVGPLIHPPAASPGGCQWWMVWGAGGFTSGLLCCLSCYLICGNALDLFIGGVLFVVLLVPPMTAIAGRMPGGWMSGGSVGVGIGTIWLFPIFGGFLTAGQWGKCMMVLLSLVFLLQAGVRCLLGLVSPLAVSAVVTLLGLAWMTWPVWLATELPGATLRISVELHPLFAINHVMANLGIWTEQQVAYNLTTLGQDAAYQLPRSAWPVIGFQLGLGAALSLLSCGVERYRQIKGPVAEQLTG